MEALSIIIPAFNMEKYIDVTQNSLLHQIEQNLVVPVYNL